MNPFLALPLFAALIATATAAVIIALNPRERANRAGALLMGSVAWWSACEVLWKQAESADVALVWHRVAALGFIFLGPHAALFLTSLHQRGLPRLDRGIPAFYAVNAIFLGVALSGRWMLAGMEHGPFGWMLLPGPLLLVWLGQTFAIVGYALLEWVRASRRSRERLDGVYAVRVAQCAAVGAAIAGGSDVVLASFGVAAPRVGSISVSLIGLAVIVALSRVGISRLNAAGLAQRIVRILPDGVALVRPSGRIHSSNPSVSELLACDPDDVEGRSIADHLDLPVLDPSVEYRAQECELLQDSGFRIPVSVSTTPVHGRSGGEPDVLLILRDVREVAALRNRLATTERLAVVGQLAGGIAHEINNPLAFIRANLHHLRRESGHLTDSVTAENAVERVRDAVAEFDEVIGESLEGIDRAMGIVLDVTTFSDAGGDTHRPIDLRELIEEALRVATLGLSPAIVVTSRLAPELPVIGSPQHLKQLFLNVLVNAIQAIGDAGNVRVDARRDPQRVLVSIVDDGCGIGGEDLPRIFFPFFTTQGPGNGSGMGLSVCHEIARSHGGKIDVTSKPEQGTRVEITLPAATDG